MAITAASRCPRHSKTPANAVAGRITFGLLPLAPIHGEARSPNKSLRTAPAGCIRAEPGRAYAVTLPDGSQRDISGEELADGLPLTLEPGQAYHLGVCGL